MRIYFALGVSLTFHRLQYSFSCQVEVHMSLPLISSVVIRLLMVLMVSFVSSVVVMFVDSIFLVYWLLLEYVLLHPYLKDKNE